MNKNVTICYSAASEKGSRAKNQDNLGITGEFSFAKVETSFFCSGRTDSDTLKIFSVCDGIGGAAMGELAAQNALMGIAQYLNGNETQDMALTDLLLCAAESAQHRVQAMYKRLRSEGGCTLTMVAVRGEQYAFLNVGDSPAFMLPVEDKEMTELSCCHNLAAIKERKGIPAGYGDECCLVNYIGKACSAVDMAHISGGTLREGDRFLLCSDGVTNAFSREELQKLMQLDVSAEELVRMAAQVRDSDNCTAIHLKLTA